MALFCSAVLMLEAMPGASVAWVFTTMVSMLISLVLDDEWLTLVALSCALGSANATELEAPGKES